MASCEHCWSLREDAEDYRNVLRRAEAEGWECTKPTMEGARLRAGQWWDEARQVDTRTLRRRNA